PAPEAREADVARRRLPELGGERLLDLAHVQRPRSGEPDAPQDARDLFHSACRRRARRHRLIGITTYAKPEAGRNTQAAVESRNENGIFSGRRSRAKSSRNAGLKAIFTSGPAESTAISLRASPRPSWRPAITRLPSVKVSATAGASSPAMTAACRTHWKNSSRASETTAPASSAGTTPW